MANPEHVEVVKQGTDLIRKWRKQNPDIRLHLHRADLVGAKLGHADLNSANLASAKLNGADFSGANLADANFNHADLTAAKLAGAHLVRGTLTGARLGGANLYRADLTRADLAGADLVHANLARANLTRANLAGSSLNFANFTSANLTDANLSRSTLVLGNLTSADLTRTNLFGSAWGSAIFANVDLASVQGLQSIRHLSPSTIGIDTLYNSKGQIPEGFLRSCGVPDGLIEYLPSLMGMQEAIQFYSCFISYSHRDEEFCQRLHSRMRDEHLRVWFAPEDMKAGRKIHKQIDQAIRVHDKLLIVLSEASMKSEWVETEIYRARQREKKEGKQVLFPIGLAPFEKIKEWEAFDADTGKDMAREAREYFIPDFSNWKDHDTFEGAFRRLLKDLRASG